MGKTGGDFTEADRLGLTRRRVLQSAGGLIAASAIPLNAISAAREVSQVTAKSSPTAAPDLTARLAKYMVAARDRALPPQVLLDAKQRVLDTIAAMISGTHLKPGEIAIRFIRTQGGTPEASVLATDIKTTAINAALINGMFAHADETDDFEAVTKAHPGSCVVPAALVIAEKEGRSGTEFLRAVALGYDLCCRFLMALGPDLVRANHRSAEGTSSTMGSVGAAASLARLDETGMHFALSYAAQQTSGLWSWVRDPDHIEKAFDFSGMGCRNGVAAVVMVQSGFTGVRDIFTGTHNVLDALSSKPQPEEMVAGLGSRFYVSESGIKTFSVGYPNQAPLDAILTLRKQYGLKPDNVERIVVHLPTDAPGIVSNSPMPDVNCQYLMATALVDGGVSFAHSHSREHMQDPQIRAVMQRVQVMGDPELNDPAAPRSGLVEVTLRDGRTVNHFTRFAPGTKENPVSVETLNGKARDLIQPVLGSKKTETLIQRVNALEEVGNMRELIRSVMTA